MANTKYVNLTAEIETRCKIIGHGRLQVAKKCAEWIQIVEERNLLDSVWRRECPNRAYCSRHGLDTSFKDAEDEGDLRIREFAAEFFDVCVSQEREELLSTAELRARLLHSNDDSDDPDACFVPVLFRPEQSAGTMFRFHDLDAQEGNLCAHVARILGSDLSNILENAPGDTECFAFSRPDTITYSYDNVAKFLRIISSNDPTQMNLPKGRYQLLSIFNVNAEEAFGKKHFSKHLVDQFNPNDVWHIHLMSESFSPLGPTAQDRICAYEGRERFRVKSYHRDIYDHLEARHRTANNSNTWLKKALHWYATLRSACCEAANWTVSLNICSDLLGISDKTLKCKDAWYEQFGTMLPPRLEVEFGKGNAFSNYHKREANVLEALVGQLHLSHNPYCTELAKILSFLCVLCALFPPNGVPPSNEKMRKNWDETEERRPIGAQDIIDISTVISTTKIIEWMTKTTSSLATLERGSDSGSTSASSLPYPVTWKEDRQHPAGGNYPYCIACQCWMDAHHAELSSHENQLSCFLYGKRLQDIEVIPDWVSDSKGWLYCTLCLKFCTMDHTKSHRHLENERTWIQNKEASGVKLIRSCRGSETLSPNIVLDPIEMRGPDGNRPYCLACAHYLTKEHETSQLHVQMVEKWRQKREAGISDAYGPESELWLESRNHFPWCVACECWSSSQHIATAAHEKKVEQFLYSMQKKRQRS